MNGLEIHNGGLEIVVCGPVKHELGVGWEGEPNRQKQECENGCSRWHLREEEIN